MLLICSFVGVVGVQVVRAYTASLSNWKFTAVFDLIGNVAFTLCPRYMYLLMVFSRMLGRRGIVAMASNAAGLNTSQFFMTLG